MLQVKKSKNGSVQCVTVTSHCSARLQQCRAGHHVTRALLRRDGYSHCSLLWVTVAVISLLAGVESLRITQSTIPPYKLRGESALLICQYDLQGETLYSMKWYHEDKEFYRYMPSVRPRQSIFDRPGVHVDLSQSNASHLYLHSLSFQSSGLYRCEVSADVSFNTLNKYGTLSVVELPSEDPRISGVREKYVAGDYLNANCSSAKSHPAAKLDWYINNKKVPSKFTLSHHPEVDMEGLEASLLELSIRLNNNHFRRGTLRLKCEARVETASASAKQDYLQQVNFYGEPQLLEVKEHVLSVNAAHRLTSFTFILVLMTSLVSLSNELSRC